MALTYPDDLRYVDSHEYVKLEGNIATIGISAFAIDQLGDIVFLELPNVGEDLTRGEAFGTVESVKAVEDLKAPLTGKVIECNDSMVDNPETLVDDPYQTGWLIKIEVNNPQEIESLLTANAYREMVEGI